MLYDIIVLIGRDIQTKTKTIEHWRQSPTRRSGGPPSLVRVSNIDMLMAGCVMIFEKGTMHNN
eukprot:11220506-Lingulodinium_polyedra.AAC.1